MILRAGTLCLVALAFASPLRAAVINPITTGNYSEEFASRDSVGRADAPPLIGTDRVFAAIRTFRAYLVYDLRDVLSPIGALNLIVNLDGISSGLGGAPADAWFTVLVGSIPFDPDLVAMPRGPGDSMVKDIYNSIVSDWYHAPITLPSAGGMALALNSGAVADAEAARANGRLWAIGFASTSQSQTFLAGSVTAQLAVITNPEPSSLVGLGIGVSIAMGLYGYRRRHDS